MIRALEINAASLVLSNDAGPLLVTPGMALVEPHRILTGTPARARAHLAPLFAYDDYWETLDLTALPRATATARTAADLAYAQLSELWAAVGADTERLLLCVPASCTHQQLRLLTGIAAAVGMPLAGFVITAVAACVDTASASRTLHLDLEATRAVLTELGRGEELARGRVEVLRAAGQRSLEEALARQVASVFLRVTRFDPLHSAVTEQQVFDRLGEWLRVATEAGKVRAAIDEAGQSIEAELTQAQFVAAAEPLCTELMRLVQTLRRAGEPVTLFLSERAASVPGLRERLAALKDCEVRVLSASAAVTGALAHAGEIVGEDIAIVSRLRGAAALDLPTTNPAQGELPTHVVLGGRAVPLTAVPLLIGRSVEQRGPGQRVLQVEGPATGLSRTHCSIVKAGGEVVVEDLSTYGSFINGERIQKRARLRVGDRLRLGTPGVTLELILMADADGTP